MVLIAVPPVTVECFVAEQVQTRSRTRQMATGPQGVAISVAGTLGCTLFRAIAVVMGIIHIIATDTLHTGAWLCHTFVVDFALVIRIGSRIAFSFESPRPLFHTPINWAATFRSKTLGLVRI